MENENAYDYIIVGQGLAGTCMAFSLLKKNQKILVVDADSGAKCSRIAAGTFNPLVFRTLEPTWKASILVPFLKAFYGELGAFLNCNLLNERGIIRAFKNPEERSKWAKKANDPASSVFMDSTVVEKIENVIGDYGFSNITQSGNVNLALLLSHFRTHLLSQAKLLEEKFDFNAVSFTQGGVMYKKIEARKIIFCQGHENASNPYFRNLPFKLTKGEAIIVEAEKLGISDIIHNRINIVPRANEEYWAGSTFDWDDKSLSTTTSASQKLLAQINETISTPVKLKEQLVGIRPTVKDRRPILGLHQKHTAMAIFNGLGTRGVMLAPFYSNQMAEYLIEGKPLDEEVNIDRFNESM